MKTFLTVMVFTCMSCFALNADEQNGKPVQNQKSAKDKEMCTPKKDMPAKAPQLLSAGDKEKMPAKTDEMPVKKQNDKLFAANDQKDKELQKEGRLVAVRLDDEQKSKESKQDALLFAAKMNDVEQKDIKKTADVKQEDEKKCCTCKTLIAGVACSKDSDDKAMQKNDEKNMKPAQKLA